MASTDLRDHELRFIWIYVNISFQSLSMCGTVYRLHYYVAVMSILLKGNLTVTLKIADTNKLLASSPCKPLTLVVVPQHTYTYRYVSCMLWWFVELSITYLLIDTSSLISIDIMNNNLHDVYVDIMVDIFCTV